MIDSKKAIERRKTVMVKLDKLSTVESVLGGKNRLIKSWLIRIPLEEGEKMTDWHRHLCC